MQNQNSKEEKIIITARLPIPLDELPSLVLKKGEEASRIIALLDNNPKRISRKICRRIKPMLHEENPHVEINEFRFDYCDSSNITHGIAYFTAILEGTEIDLREIAGDREKLFLYDWSAVNATK